MVQQKTAKSMGWKNGKIKNVLGQQDDEYAPTIHVITSLLFMQLESADVSIQ
jgi:hypothetical protein